jgi:3-methyladenine DNA glycosylase Tag
MMVYRKYVLIEMNARCEWAKDRAEIDYHDKNWGVRIHDDRGC